MHADKRKHSELNNQIIMSNVKYQQALQQAHAVIQRFIRENADAMSKQVAAAELQVQKKKKRKKKVHLRV